MEKEWIDLYKQSLLKGKEKVYNIRVMVVGPEGVGKTVLTRRLLKQHVDINRRQSTNGIDVHIEKCGTRVSDGTWEFDKGLKFSKYQLYDVKEYILSRCFTT